MVKSSRSFVSQFSASKKNLARAINRAGDKKMGEVVRELARITSVKAFILRKRITNRVRASASGNNFSYNAVLRGGKLNWQDVGLTRTDKFVKMKIRGKFGDYTRRQRVQNLKFKYLGRGNLIKTTLFATRGGNKPTSLFKRGDKFNFKNDPRGYAVADKIILVDYTVKVDKNISVEVWREWQRLDAAGIK